MRSAVWLLLFAVLSPVGLARMGWAQEAENPVAAAESSSTVPAAVSAAIEASVSNVQKNVDIIWTILAAALVFWMTAGFAMLEGGFTRAKNTGNIMAKNLMTISVAALGLLGRGICLDVRPQHEIVDGGIGFLPVGIR